MLMPMLQRDAMLSAAFAPADAADAYYAMLPRRLMPFIFVTRCRAHIIDAR